MFRWIATATLLTALTISAYHRRAARREGGTIPRSRETPGLIAFRLLLVIPLVGGLLGHLGFPARMQWASFSSGPWVRWLGVGLAGVAVPTLYWVLRSIGRNVSETILTKPDHELVTHGPYRWVMHPLYSTGILLITAIGFMTASWYLLLLAAGALILIRLVVIPREEEHLRARFGDAYQEYADGTGRLFPVLRRGRR